MQWHTCSCQSAKHRVITRPSPQKSPPCRAPPQPVPVTLFPHLPKGRLHKIRRLQLLSQQRSHPLNYLKKHLIYCHWLHKKPSDYTAQFSYPKISRSPYSLAISARLLHIFSPTARTSGGELFPRVLQRKPRARSSQVSLRGAHHQFSPHPHPPLRQICCPLSLPPLKAMAERGSAGGINDGLLNLQSG